MDVFLLEMVVERVQTNKASIATVVNLGFLKCKVESDKHTESYENIPRLLLAFRATRRLPVAIVVLRTCKKGHRKANEHVKAPFSNMV